MKNQPTYRQILIILAAHLAFLLGVLLLAASLAGCSRTSEPSTDYSPARLPMTEGSYYGDTSYAAVNPAWVEDFYSSEFRPYLSKTLTGWDERFDCNRFAALFAAQAQVRYLSDSWHREKAPQALGIGEIWVLSRSGDRHALIGVLTKQGERYFEPQTGKFVALQGVIYFRRY